MLLILTLACAVDDGTRDLQYCEDVPDERAVDPVTAPLSWAGDIEPIVQARCARCHSADDGLSALPLETYEDVSAHAFAVRDALVKGRMPPWSADACCGKEFRLDRSLSQDELDTLVGWLDQGAPLGDLDAEPVEIPASDWGSLSRVDLRVEMPRPYLASPRYGNDEVRCFLVDLPEEATGRYLVGSRVLPGNRDIVHHVVTGLVKPEQLEDIHALEALDPAMGWDCYGSGGDVRTTGGLGGYVPGQDGMEFPEGVGTWIPEGAKLVLNMHYDLSANGGEPAEDQTAIEVMLEDSVARELVGIPILHPLWLFDEGMSIPGAFVETSYGVTWKPSSLYGWRRRWEVLGAFVHMHEVGTTVSMARVLPDDTQECLLHIERWDFDWQADYWYAEGSTTLLEPEDQLYLECNWRNPGQDMAWETDQEMCVGMIYVAEVVE
ncbi:MAG: hypothetical protein H6739_15930 [Alphaproteobacteria bacterium]|nr:hypothetical protein [Alphaproteobacteria bacterium]